MESEKNEIKAAKQKSPLELQNYLQLSSIAMIDDSNQVQERKNRV